MNSVDSSALDQESMPSVLPPEGVTAARLREVADRVAKAGAGRVDVAGVRGAAAAALAAQIARATGKHVILVAQDVEEARRVAQDLAFLLGESAADEQEAEDTGQGEILVLATSESSPYADVNPDR